MCFKQSRMPWPHGLVVAYALIAAPHVHAQEVSTKVAHPQPSEETHWHYRSPLAGYQRYADSNIESWVKSNQTVQAIGGWKAYAQEPSAPTADQKNPLHENHSIPIEHSPGKRR
jgi:hypothetical protein